MRRPSRRTRSSKRRPTPSKPNKQNIGLVAWRKAAALVTLARKPTRAAAAARRTGLLGTRHEARLPWKLAKHAQKIKSIPPPPKRASYPPLAVEREKDPEDPTRIYWDMTFVFPVKKEKKDDAEEPKSDFQRPWET